MRLESAEALDVYADAYDRAVDASDLPDRFCTQSAWILPAKTAFAPHAESWLWCFDDGFVSLMKLDTPLGRTLLPLEASWGLATAIVGPSPLPVVRQLVEHITAERSSWDAIFLSGLRRGGPEFTALLHAASKRYRLGIGQPTGRCVAALDGGFDGFLSRRTAHFRKNLRRAERIAGDRLRFEVLAPTDPDLALALYERVLDVEARSWKGRSGHGIQDGPMRTFYAEMVPRLAAQGRLRVTFCWDADVPTPVGYVLGGVRGDTYRGLQISYDQALDALSVGNLLQRTTIAALCDEGVLRYDLGSDMPYKRGWAEILSETVPLVIR